MLSSSLWPMGPAKTVGPENPLLTAAGGGAKGAEGSVSSDHYSGYWSMEDDSFPHSPDRAADRKFASSTTVVAPGPEFSDYSRTPGSNNGVRAQIEAMERMHYATHGGGAHGTHAQHAPHHHHHAAAHAQHAARKQLEDWKPVVAADTHGGAHASHSAHTHHQAAGGDASYFSGPGKMSAHHKNGISLPQQHAKYGAAQDGFPYTSDAPPSLHK